MSRRATTSEKSTATATVSPNSRKNSPMMPLMNETGVNTATIAAVVATTARADRVCAQEGGAVGALAALDALLDVLDLDDGVVDQDADHQRQREQADRVQG